jgi:hypothetical protein
MKPEENSSTNQNSNTKSEPEIKPKGQADKQETTKSKKKSGFQSTLKQIGLALLFLAIGMLAILLALYLPTSNKLKTAQSELDRLIPIETQYVDLQQSYSKAEQQMLVYKLMANTSQLKDALSVKDSNRSTQYLTYIEEDLSKLDISQFPNLPISLTAQFEKAKSSVNSNSTTASDETEKFYNALLTLSDNLQ